MKQGGTVESVESPYIQNIVKLDIIQLSHTKSPPEESVFLELFMFFSKGQVGDSELPGSEVGVSDVLDSEVYCAVGLCILLKLGVTTGEIVMLLFPEDPQLEGVVLFSVKRLGVNQCPGCELDI
ncbi:hypothetical protein C0J52_04469 [Blattella germanica]|nr:hypothetical protein C0J52_04469 [Blattella germanica]